MHQREKKTPGNLCKILWINFAVIFFGMLVLEIAGQCLYYRLKKETLWDQWSKPRRVFEPHPYLAGRLTPNKKTTHSGITVTALADSTRWTGRPEADEGLIRIAVLGGSSTFGTRMTDTDTWPAMLQKKLGAGYAVYNYGVPGYSTAEAIIQMALIVPEKKPHIVVLYQGWNDIRNYHIDGTGPDYYEHGVQQWSNLQIREALAEDTLGKKIGRSSALLRGLAKARARIFPAETSAERHTRRTHDPFIDRIYARNLKTLKYLADGMGAKTLFVPQVLNESAYTGKDDSSQWTPHIENDAMPALMRRFNSVMQQICAADDPDCVVVDTTQSIPWGAQHFVDYGHFSKAGNKAFADLIYSHIMQFQ